MKMENCENCRYYRKLKIFSNRIKTIGKNNIINGFMVEKNYNKMDESYCCILFLGSDGIVSETQQIDGCECWKEIETEDN